MSAAAVEQSAVPAKVKAPKKTTVAKGEKKVAEHPAYSAMIKASIKAMADRKGSSKAAILKHVLQNYKVGGDVKKVNSRLCISLKKGADSGLFKRMKGVGATGSFRLGEKATVAKKAIKKTQKKPVAKKTTTGSPKKVVKKIAKKTTTKAKKPKTEKAKAEKVKKTTVKKAKVTKKPAAAKPKSPKKAKTAKPKKAVTKKTAAPATTA